MDNKVGSTTDNSSDGRDNDEYNMENNVDEANTNNLNNNIQEETKCESEQNNNSNRSVGTAATKQKATLRQTRLTNMQNEVEMSISWGDTPKMKFCTRGFCLRRVFYLPSL